MCAFEQRLADALSDASVHLAFDDHRVDELAEIVDRRPPVDRDNASLRVDLKLADVDASGESEVGRIPERALFQARLKLLAVELVRDIRLERHRAEVDRLVSALDREFPVLEFDVAFRGLETMAGDLLR